MQNGRCLNCILLLQRYWITLLLSLTSNYSELIRHQKQRNSSSSVFKEYFKWWTHVNIFCLWNFVFFFRQWKFSLFLFHQYCMGVLYVCMCCVCGCFMLMGWLIRINDCLHFQYSGGRTFIYIESFIFEMNVFIWHCRFSLNFILPTIILNTKFPVINEKITYTSIHSRSLCQTL